MSLNGALGLGFLFECRDNASDAIEKLKGNVEDLKKAGEETGKSLTDRIGMSSTAIAGMVAATASVIGFATFELAEHAEHFSGAILNAGIAAHASKEEIEQLETFARNNALDSLGKSAKGVAETLQELAREGFGVNESMTALDATMKLMRITSMDARDAASLVHDTIAEFGMTADQSGELVDKLAFAMREFHFRAEELRPAMAGLASGAHLVHASFDDTLIGVGILKDAFPNATKAAMAMNIALQQLASTNTQKELRGIGVSVRDTSGNMRPLLDIIQDLSGKTANLTESQLSHKLATIGSARAAGGLAVIIDQLRKGTKDASGALVTGGAALDVYREKLANTEGTADGLVDLLNDSFGASITKVQNAISNFGEMIGKNFEGPWKSALATVNLFVRGLTQLFSQGGFSGEVMKELDKTDNQGLQGFLIKIYVWVGRIKNFFSEMVDSFKASFEKYQPVIDQITDALKILGGALGLTGVSSKENGDAFDSAGESGKALGDTLGDIAGLISDVALVAVDLLTASVILMTAAWKEVGPMVKDAFKIIGGVMQTFASNDFPTFWEGLVDISVGLSKLMYRGFFAIFVKPLLELNDWISHKLGGHADTVSMGERAEEYFLKDADQRGVAAKEKYGHHPGIAAATPGAKAAAQASGGSTTTQPEQIMTLLTNIHLDGEKIATAIAKHKRSSDARSFTPVGAY